jgi:hypothetical protein
MDLKDKIYDCFNNSLIDDYPSDKVISQIEELILQVSLSACYDSKIREELERIQNESNSTSK